MAARDREKLGLQGREEIYGCKRQRKNMAEKDYHNGWIRQRKKTMDKYGCQGQRKTMAARFRGKIVDARDREKSNGCQGQKKTIVTRDRENYGLLGTEENYG